MSDETETDFLSANSLAAEAEDSAPYLEPEADPEPAATAPVADKPKAEEATVPLAALQQVREENRTLKAIASKVASLEAALAAQTPRPEAPDPITDPEGFRASVLNEVQAIQANMFAEISERSARSAHGDTLVDAALEAAQAKGVVDQFRNRRDPWGDLTAWHKAQVALAEIGPDPAAFKERLRAELLAEIQASGQSGKPPVMAPTIAGQPNLGPRTAPAWAGPIPTEQLWGKSRG